jgi:hypothetical protein
MTTSLQRRSANGNTNHNPCSSKGAFELCFAQGLDLSEFGGSSTTSLAALSTRVVHKDDNDQNNNNNNNINAGSHVQGAHQQQHCCASAELLPMIQKRAQERHYNEQEEFRLHETIQRRAWNIQQELKGTTTTTTTTTSSNNSTHPSSCTMLQQDGPVRQQNINNTNNSNTILTLADTLVSMHGRDDFGGGKTVSAAKTVSKAKTGSNQSRKHNQPKYNRTRNDAAQGGRRRLPATLIQSHGLGIKKGIQKSNRIKYY